MKLRVRNLLGVRAADMAIPASGVALVAGLNGAGKSSLLEAIRCAALGTAKARGVTTKGAAGRLLHDGAEAGSATLDWGIGSCRVAFPEASVETKGEAKEIGSPLGIGAVSWMSLKLEARQAEFAARCAAEPTVEDIAAFLNTPAEGEDPPDAETRSRNAALAAQLFERVKKSGWDAVLKTAAEEATKLKGAWEQVTKQRWGDAKARTWRPATLLPDEVYDPEEVKAKLADARRVLRETENRGIVDEAEVARLEPIAADLKEREKVEAEAFAASRIAATAGEQFIRDLNALPPESEMPSQKCPHCQGLLVLGRTANGLLVINAPSRDAPNAVEWEKIKRKREAFEQGLKDATEAAREKTAAAALAKQHAAEARSAVKRLAEIRDQAAAASAEELAAAKRAVIDLETVLGDVLAWFEARRVYAKWLSCQPLIAALAPGGVRRVVAERALAGINAELAGLSEAGEWAPVALAADMSLTLGGRDYGLLSESEQWRADTTMALVLAKREGAALVTLDRLDVLERSRRGPALRAIIGWGIPAVVAVTAPDKLPADKGGSLPRLKQAGAGACFWIEAGALEELAW